MVEVIVNPTPDLLDPSDQQVCNSNLTAPVNFTGSVPGTVYNWVNDDPSIGLAASGTGNIASFVAENLTNFPVIATITVTPSYTNPNGGTTCQGTSQSFTITVYPQVTVTATPSSQSIASGTATNITLTSNTGTATFSWDAALTSGTASGFSGGSGSTIAQTLTNTSSTLATVTYTITPSDNGCPSIPTTVVVTVYPEITAIATPPSQTICSGNTTNIVLSSNTGTATFTWTASLTAGMATGFSNGSGDTIAQTLTNNNNTVALITYTITPNDNGFPGIPIIVVVTVFPEVTVTATPPAETICSSGTTSIALTSNTGNATFSWTAALTSGIASGFSNGSGSTIAQTLSNNSGVVATTTYTITPLANGCPGIPGDVIITISPEVITSPIWHN